MRFVAAFMVVVCHARGYHWVEWGRLPSLNHTVPIEIFYAITRPGNEWVVVFFVLSGFLVGGRVIERSIDHDFDLRLFLIDRTTRIWVPLLPALFFTFIISLYCGVSSTTGEFFGNLLGFQGVFFKNFAQNEPLWSLSYEIWFYILIGSVGVILSSKGKNSVIPVILLGVCFAVFTILLPVFLFVWLLGVCCFFIVSEKQRHGLICLGFIVGILGMTLSQLRTETLSFGALEMLKNLPSWYVALLIEGAGIGLLTVAICREVPKGNFMKMLEGMGTTLAAFSYTLYLTHYPVLNLWEHFIPARSTSVSYYSSCMFSAKIISCIVVAWLFYLPFEARTSFVRNWIKTKVWGSSP